MVALLVVVGIGLGSVTKLFFPDSSMTKFMVDLHVPEGIRIRQVALDLEQADARLMADERVESASAFIGAGPPRFYLSMGP